MIETPDTKPINITASSTLGPYNNNLCANSGLCFEIKLPNICPPSNGYTGSKLNIARLIFILISR